MKVRISPSLEKSHNGVGMINLRDYEDFDYVIREILLDYPQLIYRGQSRANWALQSTIDRLFISAKGHSPTNEDASDLLRRFKYSTRGRLPAGWIPNDDNSWWALGQHFGLATPLLDWTESPFVAAFFAFSEQTEKATVFPNRVIWALDPAELEKKCRGLEPIDRVEIVHPLSDQNARLVNQRGLFTRLPIGRDLEDWVKDIFFTEEEHIILIKIIIPELDNNRDKFLRFLNRANINTLTLFPDLMGASLHCNNNVLIDNYE